MTALWFKGLNKPATDNGTQATEGFERKRTQRKLSANLKICQFDGGPTMNERFM
jgi:hypothetical protein